MKTKASLIVLLLISILEAIGLVCLICKAEPTSNYKDNTNNSIIDTIQKENSVIESIKINKILDREYLDNVSIKLIEYEIEVKSKNNTLIYYTNSQFKDCGLNKYNKSNIDKKSKIEKSNWYLEINSKYLHKVLYGSEVD